jgi:hypothetical protein
MEHDHQKSSKINMEPGHTRSLFHLYRIHPHTQHPTNSLDVLGHLVPNASGTAVLAIFFQPLLEILVFDEL